MDGLAEEHECVSEAPYITRQTVAYAISLTVSALFYAVNDESNMGRADEVTVYDKALRDLQQLTDDKFTEVLGGLLQYYVQNVTSPEAPGPRTMLLSRQEVAVINRGLGSSSDFRAADAPADAPAVAPAVAPDVAGAPTDADAPPDASDASSDDASVAKSTSGSDDSSVARSTAAPKDNVKGNKKAGGPGRGGAAAGCGGATAAPPKSPPAKRGRGGAR